MADALAWVTAGAATVGAVATAFAAAMSYRSAAKSSEAADRALRALALHHQPMVEFSTTEFGTTLQIDCNYTSPIPGPQDEWAVRWWKLEWTAKSGISGTRKSATSPQAAHFELANMKHAELASVTIEGKDSETGLTWFWESTPGQEVPKMRTVLLGLR